MIITISQPIIKKEEFNAVNKVLSSKRIAQGPKVAELEEWFIKLCGTRYAIATNNGTSALHTALFAIGITSHNEIITTPFTFIATANSILMVRATPVFVDIEEKTFNIDPKQIEKAITKKTKAIITVDLYGQPADYDQINKIAKKFKLIIIEDAAQSINANYQGKKSGNLGDIGCFSLYATKNIMCGEGGMITTNNKNFYERAKLFRNHGQPEGKRYDYIDLGYNYRMTDILAAIAIEQLKKVNQITKKRQENAKRYDRAFRHIKGLVTPYVGKDRTHAYHQYTLRITDKFNITRDELKMYLEKKGIQSNIYYPKPLYYFNHLKKYKRDNYKTAERISKEVLSIPVHPLLTNREIDYIIDTITSI